MSWRNVFCYTKLPVLHFVLVTNFMNNPCLQTLPIARVFEFLRQFLNVGIKASWYWVSEERQVYGNSGQGSGIGKMFLDSRYNIVSFRLTVLTDIKR